MKAVVPEGTVIHIEGAAYRLTDEAMIEGETPFRVESRFRLSDDNPYHQSNEPPPSPITDEEIVDYIWFSEEFVYLVCAVRDPSAKLGVRLRVKRRV